MYHPLFDHFEGLLQHCGRIITPFFRLNLEIGTWEPAWNILHCAPKCEIRTGRRGTAGLTDGQVVYRIRAMKKHFDQGVHGSISQGYVVVSFIGNIMIVVDLHDQRRSVPKNR